MTDTADPVSHVSYCIISGFDYANNCNLVFSNLAQKSKNYVDGFLKVLTDILTSPEYPPHSKFYAVHLLMKASEADLDTILTRLTRNRALLDKLFKDAQNDGSKPLEERGKKIFSKTPSPEEAVIGNNYVMLLLEGFKYWSENVQIKDTAPSGDPKQSKDPMQIYRVTYARLAEKYTFPEPYLYFTRNYKITEDFHLKPYQTLAKLPVSPSAVPKSKYSTPASPGEETKVSPTKSNKSGSSSSNPVKEQILACISSGHAYKNNSGIIFKNIQGETPSYVPFYIKAITDLFLSKQLPPVSQFYILYLLLKTTETRNETLVNALHANQNLLNELFIQAQTDKAKDLKERGKTFFSKNPSADESRLGHNYITLILEALVFWGDAFVPKKSDKNIFDVIIKTLQTKTKLPQIQQLYYVGYDHDTDSPYLATTFELASGEDLIEIIKATKGTAGGSSAPTGGEDENNPAIRDIKNALEQLDQNKTSLRDVLQNNNSDREIVDLLDYFFADLNNTYDKIVTPKIDPLLIDGPPSSEKYITQVLHEGETVQNIHNEYGAYKNKKLSYSQLRTRVLNLLGSQNPVAAEKVENVTPGGPGASNWETPGNPALDQEEEENFFREEERKETPVAVVIEKSHSSTSKVETVQYNRPSPVIEERAAKTSVEETSTTTAYRNGAPVQDIHDIDIAESVMTKNPAATHKVQQKNLAPIEAPISEKQELDSAEFEDPRRQKFYANDLETDQGSAGMPYASKNSSFGHKQPFVEPSPTLAQQVYEKPQSPKQESPQPVTKEALRESVPAWASDYKFKAGSELHEDVDDQLKKSAEKLPQQSSTTKPTAVADKIPQQSSTKKSEKLPTSLKNTPGRKIDTDPEEQQQSRLLGSGLKTSKIKANELSEIENSIRHSFVASGKRPPNFKPLSERQIQEDLEKEINRLKSEKEALQRENIKLENQMKSGDFNANNNSEQLVQLLSQHQERIEALQEETVGLSEENTKLKRNLAVEKKYNAVVENEDEIRKVLDENYTLQERVKDLEKQVNFYRTENENMVSTHRLAASTVHQGNEVFGRSTQFGELTDKKSNLYLFIFPCLIISL